MTTEEKEKFNEEQSSNSDLEKENKSSFFGRLKTQVSNLKTKVEKLAFEEFEDDDANHEDEEELNRAFQVVGPTTPSVSIPLAD